MILTHENLHAIANGGCGFNTAQLHLLDVTEMKSGWLRRLIGTEIHDDTYALLLRLKGAKRKEQLALVPNRRPFPGHSEARQRPTDAERLQANLERIAKRYSVRMPIAEILATMHRFPAHYLATNRGSV